MEIKPEQLRLESIAEKVIDYMKSQDGSIDLQNRIDDIFKDKLTLERVSRFIFAYGLTIVPYPDNPYHQRLTKIGWNFKGFQDDRNEIDETKRLQKEQIQSVVDTNNSVKCLNSKTEIFYEKQKGYSEIQTRLTWVIAIATGLYTLFTILTFWASCNNGSTQQSIHIQSQRKLQRSNNIIQYPANHDLLKNTKSQNDAQANH